MDKETRRLSYRNNHSNAVTFSGGEISLSELVCSVIVAFRPMRKVFLVLFCLFFIFASYYAIMKSHVYKYTEIISLPSIRPGNDITPQPAVSTGFIEKEFLLGYVIPWRNSNRRLVSDSFIINNVITPKHGDKTKVVLAPSNSLVLHITASKKDYNLVQKLFADSVQGLRSILTKQLPHWITSQKFSLAQQQNSISALKDNIASSSDVMGAGTGGLTEAHVVMISNLRGQLMNLENSAATAQRNLDTLQKNVTVTIPLYMAKQYSILHNMLLALLLSLFLAMAVSFAIIGLLKIRSIAKLQD